MDGEGRVMCGPVQSAIMTEAGCVVTTPLDDMTASGILVDASSVQGEVIISGEENTHVTSAETEPEEIYIVIPPDALDGSPVILSADTLAQGHDDQVMLNAESPVHRQLKNEDDTSPVITCVQTLAEDRGPPTGPRSAQRSTQTQPSPRGAVTLKQAPVHNDSLADMHIKTEPLCVPGTANVGTLATAKHKAEVKPVSTSPQLNLSRPQVTVNMVKQVKVTSSTASRVPGTKRIIIGDKIITIQNSADGSASPSKRPKTAELDKQYICKKCKQAFESQTDLNKHVALHDKLKACAFPCFQCEMGFDLVEQYRAHIMTHAVGKKSYTCDFCGVTIRNYSCFLTHRRTHTGEKPFKCDLCQAGFTHATSLRSHMQIHENLTRVSFKKKTQSQQNCNT